MAQKLNWDYLRQIKDLYHFSKAKLIKPRKIKGQSNRILIVNPCLVGDFIVSLPALSQFIKKNKSSKIDLIVAPPLKQLAMKIKGIRRVFTATTSGYRSIERTERGFQHISGNYDKVMIMRISKESYELIKNTRTKKVISPLFKTLKYQYFYPVIAGLLKKKQLTRREIDFRILNQKFKNVTFEEIFDFNQKDYAKIRALGALSTRKKIVIIHTEPGWPMRRWSNDKWVDLIKKINATGKFRFIFVGAKEEIQDYKYISKNLNFKVYSLIGKVDLKDLMLVLRCSDYFIGVDSGPRNMAHLADLRSITLFGAGASGRIYMPFDKRDIIIDKSNGGAALEVFINKKNKITEKITSDEVFDAFLKITKK